MLQHKFIAHGQSILKIQSFYRLSIVSHRSVHGSPTIPHPISSTPVLPLTDKLPSSCYILIASDGILGQSIADHLSEIGVKDIVLVEKAKVASGAIWQSSGRVSSIQNTFIETHFTKYSRQLYERLHKEGHDIGFSEKGSLWVAQTSDRLHTLKRQYSIIKALPINCEMLSMEKLVEKVPITDPYEIWGGLWLPNDFMVDPVLLALTFVRLAIEKGVKIIENCHVEEILTEKQRAGQYDRVTSAVTSLWNRKYDVFISCTGMVSDFPFDKEISFDFSYSSGGHENLGFSHYQVFEFPPELVNTCLRTKPIRNLPNNIPTVHNPEERFYIQT